MPRLVQSAGVSGALSRAAAQSLGLVPGTPVAGGGTPGLTRPTWYPFVNQIAPSGPAVIPRGELGRSRGNVVTWPEGVIFPM